MKVVFLLLLTLIAIGVTFFRTVPEPHLSLREALLEVVLIFSTLGFDTRNLTNAHTIATVQWFCIFYISTILIVVLWGVSVLIEAMAQGELVYYWGARRMEQRIARMHKHYIVCGFGRMGQEIAQQLTRGRKPFVVIEHNPNQFPNLEESGALYVQGDAREDENLLKAGIQRAKGLIAVYSTDEENVFITLSARVLNPNIYIVTRSSSPAADAKLLRAGADRVFSPYVIGGRRMAQAVLQPSVVDFLDTVVHGEQMDLVMEEVTLQPGAILCGKTMEGGTDIECLGVHLLGIVTGDGKVRTHQLASYEAKPGDTFILLGEPGAIDEAVRRLTGMQP